MSNETCEWGGEGGGVMLPPAISSSNATYDKKGWGCAIFRPKEGGLPGRS